MLQSLSPANASERRDSDGGFSLVEIMVALAIFLVASAAVLGLVMLSLGTVRENSDRVSAATLARGQLDSLRGASYAEIQPFIEASVEESVDTESGPFTQVTSARWCYFNETVDTDSPSVECPDVSSSAEDEVDPGNECSANIGSTIGLYLRLDVEVASEKLDGPQVVSSLIPAAEVLEGIDQGTLTVQVTDSSGALLNDVTILIDGTQYPVSGGCIFVPELQAGSDTTVSVSDLRYITEDVGAETQVVSIDPFTNTQLTLVIERPGIINLEGKATKVDATELYTVPCGVAVEFEPDSRRSAPDQFPDRVDGDCLPGSDEMTIDDLWPGTYTSWLSPCTGSADNILNTSSVTVGPGELKTLALSGSKVQLVGRAGQRVSVTYDPVGYDGNVANSPCIDSEGEPTAPPTFDLGVWDDGRVQQLLLPDGVWTFTSGSSSITVQLPEPADGNTDVLTSNDPGLCSVPFSGLPDESAATLLGAPVLDADLNEQFIEGWESDGQLDRSTEVIRLTSVPEGSTVLEVKSWSKGAPDPGDLLIVDSEPSDAGVSEEVFVVTGVSDDGLVVTIGSAGPNAPDQTQTAHAAGATIKISKALEPRCSRL